MRNCPSSCRVACLLSDYSGRNRALRKLTANALTIENLRYGFAFEEIGAGFNRSNLRRFLLECLKVASSASNLDIQLVAIRRLMDRGSFPYLNRALCRVRDVVIASCTSSTDRKSNTDWERIDRELKELQTLAGIPQAGSDQAVDSAEELVGLIKVRHLVSSLRSFCKQDLRFSQKLRIAGRGWWRSCRRQLTNASLQLPFYGFLSRSELDHFS